MQGSGVVVAGFSAVPVDGGVAVGRLVLPAEYVGLGLVFDAIAACAARKVYTTVKGVEEVAVVIYGRVEEGRLGGLRVKVRVKPPGAVEGAREALGECPALALISHVVEGVEVVGEGGEEEG